MRGSVQQRQEGLLNCVHPEDEPFVAAVHCVVDKRHSGKTLRTVQVGLAALPTAFSKADIGRMSSWLSRTGLAWIVAAFSLCISLSAQPTQTEVNFAWVTEKAKERATKGYSSQKSDLPEQLTKLNYDSYREIRFRHDKALWRDEELTFRLEFFHLGYL